jgi:uncharacterized protein
LLKSPAPILTGSSSLSDFDMRRLRTLLIQSAFVFSAGFSVCVRAGSYDDFFQALNLDDVSTVQSLLLRGFDPNTVDSSTTPALVSAQRHGSNKVALLLAQHPDTQIDVRTPSDETPLMLAALKGQLSLCKLLIERDADVNKTGWTPLHYAATGNHVEVIKLLLENHAYLDAESPNGSTPLMMAALYGGAEAVNTLLDAGADPTLRNTLGLSALDFATRGSRKDAAERIAASIRARSPQGW